MPAAERGGIGVQHFQVCLRKSGRCSAHAMICFVQAVCQVSEDQLRLRIFEPICFWSMSKASLEI